MNDNKTLIQTSLDIENAREKVDFSIKTMYHLIRGGSEAVKQLEHLRSLVQNEPILSRAKTPFQNRQEQLHSALLVSRRLMELKDENSLSDLQFSVLLGYLDMALPIILNFMAFIPVIKSQGTDDQIEKWYNEARKCLIIGCYAQTELSHGSNVMALKTSAVYDQNSDQFVIHTPDITAAKWWIGGLGIACTHAVVQAQLIIGDKSYGPHLFIVPIRSPIDLNPLKGITVGDIGPKAYGGSSGNDNGYVIFDQVSIPRENMLMRFSQVTRDGEYISPVHSKMAYGSMVKIRVDLITEAGWKLAKAVTIATRYCTVRRQFYTPGLSPSSEGNHLELQVISYSSVQHRLMPLIATAFALIISGEDMYTKLNKMTSLLEENNAEMLPEVHASSCALKSWGTRRSTDGIEESRKSMGGHGYSIFSGLSELFATFVPSNTYEGENYVLSQQVARFLLKQLGNMNQGKGVTSATTEYLNILAKKTTTSFKFESSEQIFDPNVQLHIFGMRAARLVANLEIQLKSGTSWSDLNMECWAVNLAHAEYLIMKSMIQKVGIIRTSPKYTGLVNTMKIISDLVCLSTIAFTSLATFLSTSTIDTSDFEMLNEQYRITISRVANIAIPLTDSFGFTDYELNTALGKKDGRAYEHLWEAVQNNPVNMDEENSKLSKLVLDILHRGNGLKRVKESKL